MKINLKLDRSLPVLGVVAFSGCSIWSLYHMFLSYAKDDTPLYAVAAALVEVITALIAYQVVHQARRVTYSNLSQQDRRFALVMLGAFLVLAIPTLGVSVTANTLEFGNVWLGLLFPVASVTCAICAALPDVENEYRQRRESERQKKEADRKEKAKAKLDAAARTEADRKAQETQRQSEETLAERLGNMAATLRLYQETPTATQAEIAERAGLSERTIRNHLTRLEAMGVIRRNGHNGHAGR